MKVLVTGANGFVGKNLCATLHTREDFQVFEYDIDNTIEDLKAYTKECDFVVHLAGVNRPIKPEEFYEGNAGFTETLCKYLKLANNTAGIMISSSIQADLDNDYGKSKKEGEELLKAFGKENGNPIYIYRFANLFGKWCRPNYNSVIATWCHNVSHEIEIKVNDPTTQIEFCYIDDVVNEIINCCKGKAYEKEGFYAVSETYRKSLGEIRDILYQFKSSRENLFISDQKDEFKRKLYATYLSYLPKDQFSYPLKMNVDERGSFTEFIKTGEYGQVSINISHPGITKGNHWHHSKNEKFLVVSGKGLIQFRKIGTQEILDYHVSGEKLEVIDIPTGYTHNIINEGTNDLVTVMWANELFDPEKPDTYYEVVK